MRGCLSPVRSVLLCTRAPWPPVGGDRLRTFQLTRALSTLGPCTVLTLGDPGQRAEIARGLPFAADVRVVPLGRLGAGLRVARAALASTPLQQALYAEPAVRAEVARACADADLVVAHLVRTAAWLPPERPPVLLCLQDALAAQAAEAGAAPGHAGGWRRAALRLEQPRLHRAELEAAARSDRVSVITERDRDLLAAAGVDPSRMFVTPASVERIAETPSTPTPDTILFAGNLRTASNRDMAVHLARRILPMVRTQRRSVRLRIVGVQAPREVTALGGLPGVTVVGPVPDMDVEMRAAWLTVCPLRFGSGVQNKVLESLAAGTPVVATQRVLDTLHPDAARCVRTGSHDRALAVHILKLLGDLPARNRLGAAGIAFVRQHHGPAAFDGLLHVARSLALRVR